MTPTDNRDQKHVFEQHARKIKNNGRQIVNGERWTTSDKWQRNDDVNNGVNNDATTDMQQISQTMIVQTSSECKCSKEMIVRGIQGELP